MSKTREQVEAKNFFDELLWRAEETYDFILVQGEGSNTQCVWVAKAVALLRISFGNEHSKECVV